MAAEVKVSPDDVDAMIKNIQTAVNAITEVYARLPGRQTVETVAEYDMGLKAKKELQQILMKLGQVLVYLQSYKQQLLSQSQAQQG